MLDTDDLEYESEYREDEDYDEVLEMDGSEQTAMGGELPCAHLALRMGPRGVTTGLPGLCWSDASTSHLAAGPRSLWLGGFGICSPLDGTRTGCAFPITALCRTHRADLTLHPPHQSCHRQ